MNASRLVTYYQNDVPCNSGGEVRVIESIVALSDAYGRNCAPQFTTETVTRDILNGLRSTTVDPYSTTPLVVMLIVKSYKSLQL